MCTTSSGSVTDADAFLRILLYTWLVRWLPSRSINKEREGWTVVLSQTLTRFDLPSFPFDGHVAAHLRAPPSGGYLIHREVERRLVWALGSRSGGSSKKRQDGPSKPHTAGFSPAIGGGCRCRLFVLLRGGRPC